MRLVELGPRVSSPQSQTMSVLKGPYCLLHRLDLCASSQSRCMLSAELHASGTLTRLLHRSSTGDAIVQYETYAQPTASAAASLMSGQLFDRMQGI
jgi:hypothetical protein